MTRLPVDDSSDISDSVELIPIPRPPRRVLLPVLLFVATCLSTLDAHGPAYALAVMTTLLAHELGHFLQAVRYRVPASLPYFIPFPFGSIGTMGAVIGMQPGVGNRRELFDIGITGPLAGLVPALIVSIVGLRWSEIIPAGPHEGLTLGEPLLFKMLSYFTFGSLSEGQEVSLHPVAFAGWVGIFITALNMFPIGQLDGGHTLYALLLKRSHIIAQLLLVAIMAAVAVFGYWGWSVMIALVIITGPRHPPTANDNMPLGTARTIIGWLALLLVPLGFTPVPFSLPK